MVLALLTLMGCSGGTDATADTAASLGLAPLRLDDLIPAVDAVEAALGGPQQYTEINVQSELVNVFVARADGTELAYVYRNGALEPPVAPTLQPEGAVLFSLDGVPLEPVAGFDELLAGELPESTPVRLTLTAAAAGGVQWTVTMAGSKGTAFDVLISPEGVIVGALPR